MLIIIRDALDKIMANHYTLNMIFQRSPQPRYTIEKTFYYAVLYQLILNYKLDSRASSHLISPFLRNYFVIKICCNKKNDFSFIY